MASWFLGWREDGPKGAHGTGHEAARPGCVAEEGVPVYGEGLFRGAGPETVDGPQQRAQVVDGRTDELALGEFL
jgi:hypothetical protein